MHRSAGFRVAAFVVLLLSALSFFTVATANDDPLTIGILPYLSTRSLFEQHDALRQFLQRRLKREVRFYTAKNFKEFYKSTARGDFDLVITAPHFARLAQIDYGYEPLAGYTGGVSVLLVVAKDSPIKGPQDLRGRVLAVPDRLAVVVMAGLLRLKELGLLPGRDYTVVTARSFNTAVMRVALNEADAALSAPPPLAQLPEDIRNRIRVLEPLGEVAPGLAVEANPRISKVEQEQLRRLWVEFGTKTEEGKAFLVKTGFQAIVPYNGTSLRHMDRFLPDTREYLSVTP
jgi:phosphonate transport system substrate-binding protein